MRGAYIPALSIFVPVHASEEAGANTTVSASEACSIIVLKVLVAEDHDINRFIIEKILKDWNYEYDFAMNGEDAVAYANKKEYDLILMDIEMPDIDGYGILGLTGVGG